MSSEQMFVVTKRKANKLCLDSQEQARFEAEQRQRQQQTRLRKEQKRKRKEQQARRIEQEAKKRLQQKQKYQNPQTMLLEDSDSKDAFERVEKKIRRSYPEFKPRDQAIKRRHASQSSSSDEQSNDDSEQEESQEIQKKKKAEKKVKKQKADKKADDGQVRQIKVKLEKVKIQQDDPKEKLVKQVAIRWWYCLPEWPSKNYPYEAQLKKLGYRLIEASQFRMEQNLVNGLYKVHAVEGYVGVFRSKLKIIDIRPNKESAPSLRLLKSKSQQQLINLLKKALKQQYRQLSSQKYLLSQETELLTQIQRRLKQLN